ncbi:MAG: terminase TerL endonuclease subunit [Sulfurimonas sp.]
MLKPYYEKTFERHRRDIEAVERGEKPHLRFNKKLGMAYITVLQSFRHYKGAKAKKKELFVLEEWQKKAVAIWGGWEKLNSDGKWVRRFGESFWFVPKKNGKTILGSGLGIADSIIRGEQGGEVYSFATKEEQAKLAWTGFDELIKNHDELKQYRELAYSTLRLTKNNTIFKALGRDSKTIDGINASFGLADERHAHPDNSLRDNVKSSMAAREQPHMMDITTAGFNIASPCYLDYEHAKKVVEGTIEDDDLFVFVAEAPQKPEGDEYDDWYFREEVWEAANPNYGVSVDKDFLANEAKKAKERPEKLNAFLVKHLNVWTTAAQSYLPLDKWNACKGEVDATGSFIGGMDLSLTDDFSSFMKVYKKGDKYHIKGKYYVPADTLQERERTLRVPLLSWATSGYITATPGETINYMYIYNDIIKDIGNMEAFCYDVYKAKKLVKLIAEPLDTDTLFEFDEDMDHNNLDMYKGTYDECIPIVQGYRDLSEPTITLLNLIKDGKIVHDGDPVLAWMVSNMVVTQNAQGNVMPDKSEPSRKIDGVAAVINALAYLIHKTEKKETSVYEERGMRSL